MSELYKVFDESGLTTLTNHMKVTRSATDANITDIEGLGQDLAGLAEAVAAELEGKQDALTFDTTPTEGSTNPVTSGGVLEYVNANAGGVPIVTATSTDGVTYTATVPGMDSLVVGKEFVIIPDTASTVINPKLNVNGLGDKYLRCPIGTNNATTTTAASANWIYASKPVSVRWNGSFFVTDIFRADANNLYGTVPIAKGGTGATDAATALTNLGIDEDLVLITLDDIHEICYVIPANTFQKVRAFQDGKEYILLFGYNGAYYCLSNEAFNDWTVKASTVSEVTSTDAQITFATVPTLFTARASGNGFTLHNGSNNIYGEASSGGTALRVNTDPGIVFTVDTSEMGGFDSDEIIAKVDNEAVWLRSSFEAGNTCLKFESANTSVGIDYKDRDTTYSTGFVSFILYEKIS